MQTIRVSRVSKSFFPVVLFGCLLFVTSTAEPLPKFERTYTPQSTAHLSISNTKGSITVTAWTKKSILVRANTDSSVNIQDEVRGDDIDISVKPDVRLGRADFEVFVPAQTSISIKNMMGKIEVTGITGHVSVSSIDSDVRLVAINSPSVETKVTSGNIYFDGTLHNDGSYLLQSMKGDLDVTLPGSMPFNLNARALSENINLGDFSSNLAGITRGNKGITGTHLRGGPRLTLTAYAGRILLHKK